MVELGCCYENKLEKFQIVDYQIPVNRVQYSNDGKIDLVLTSSKGVYIGELKDNKSQESLLRAILEVQTYYDKVSHDKLKDCYQKDFVGKAILLFDGTRPFKEFDNEDYQWTNKLLRRWDILVFKVCGLAPFPCEILPQNNNFSIYKIN